VELHDARGDPERPLSRRGIVEKARQLIMWGDLAEGEADRAVALALDHNGPMKPLLRLLEDWL
jgi:hypothetical protein